MTRICGHGKVLNFLHNKNTVFDKLQVYGGRLHPTMIKTKIGSSKNTGYFHEGFKVIYRDRYNGICAIPMRGQYGVRALNTLEANSVYKELGRKQLIPLFYQCGGKKVEKIVVPNSFARKFDAEVTKKVRENKERLEKEKLEKERKKKLEKEMKKKREKERKKKLEKERKEKLEKERKEKLEKEKLKKEKKKEQKKRMKKKKQRTKKRKTEGISR
ncbi:hypothetical protein SNEBB_000966, partial [Seison nebaliae]